MWSADTLEWVDVELTSHCNIKCPGCLRSTSSLSEYMINKGHMEKELLFSKVNRFELPKLRLINFCGNIDEATMHPEFEDIINHYSLHNRRTGGHLSVNLATNGSVRTARWWEKMGKISKNWLRGSDSSSYSGFYVCFALDGTDDVTHQKYRVGSPFNKVLNNAKAFMNAGGKAHWQFILFEHNKHQLEEARTMAKELGFRKFRVVNSMRETKADTQYKPIIKEQKASPKIECKYGNQKRVQINWNGNIMPCCYLNPTEMAVNALPPAHRAEKIKRFMGPREKDFAELYFEHGMELSNSMYYNSVSEVIEGDMFKEITDRFESNPLQRCLQKCQYKIADHYDDDMFKENSND